jgi:hypothetical protein
MYSALFPLGTPAPLFLESPFCPAAESTLTSHPPPPAPCSAHRDQNIIDKPLRLFGPRGVDPARQKVVWLSVCLSAASPKRFKVSLTHKRKLTFPKRKKTSRVGDLKMYISMLMGKPNIKAVVKFLLA